MPDQNTNPSLRLELPDGTFYPGRIQYREGRAVVEMITCGTCGFTWNDALITSITPVPAGRTPCEYCHEEDDEPEEEDAFLSPAGPLGARTALAYNGHHVGVFATEDDAEAVLRLLMERDGFYPNVWSVSDHGNFELRVIS